MTREEYIKLVASPNLLRGGQSRYRQVHDEPKADQGLETGSIFILLKDSHSHGGL